MRPALYAALLAGWYALAVLPYLDNYPAVIFDEAGIAAPAAKLARESVYGNDLFAGYYESERYNYEYMPLYPLLTAAAFKVFGAGVVQARAVSLVCGLALAALTFDLGRRLFDAKVGLLAAAALVCARLSADPRGSGVLLLDLGRIARYDVLTALLVTAACCAFAAARRRGSAWLFAAAGGIAGLATLSHPNGALILPVLALALLWQRGWGALRHAQLPLIVGGWLLAMVPWLAYVAQNPAAFRGQMLRHEALGRFDLLDPAFYLANLLAERDRYGRLLDLRAEGLPIPTLGLAVGTVAALAGAHALIGRRKDDGNAARPDSLAASVLLPSIPVLALLLALLIGNKYYGYLLLLAPFAAILAAGGAAGMWRRAQTPLVRASLAVVAAAVLLEGGAGVAHSLVQGRAASSYEALSAAIARTMPPGARLLIYHQFWFGLPGFETRSVLLPFYLSTARYHPDGPVPIDEALRQIAPEYVLADGLVEPEPWAPPGPDAEAQRRGFSRFLRRQCGTLVTRIDSPTYGRLSLYRCASKEEDESLAPEA